MIDCQSKTEHNCHDPEKVEDIMSVWSPYDGTRWLQNDVIRVGCQASTQEGGAQVDSDAGEPDHEEGEEDALTVVPEQETDVL